MKNKFKKLRKIIFPIMLGVILVTIPLIYIQLKSPGAVEAGWFDDNWMYRKKITVTYTGSENLTEYQVQVKNIDTGTLVTNGQMQSDCDDIRFTNVYGNILDYFIVGASCNTSDTDIFVKTDSIPASNIIIYMYYGNKTAVGYSNEVKTFSYKTEKTIAYLLGDEGGGDDWTGAMSVYSLHSGNSITHNSTTVSLGVNANDTSSISANDFSPITAKGLVAITDDDQSEIPTPVSWAGTEFFGYTNDAGVDDSFYIMNPWGSNATIELYLNGTKQTTCGILTSSSYTLAAGSGAEISCDLTDDARFRLISTNGVPFLAYYGGVRNTLSDRYQRPLYPSQDSTGDALFGYASSDAYIEAGPNGADYSYIKDSDASPTTGSIAANGVLNLSPASSLFFDVDAGPYKISSTTSGDTLSADQRGDGDGTDATSWLPRTEFGTIMGMGKGTEYIAPVSDQAATCKTYKSDSTLLDSKTLTSTNTAVYGLPTAGDFGTDQGSSTYIATQWYMICDKPTYAWWHLNSGAEKHAVTWPMMRQFTYPTPLAGTPGTEEKSPSPVLFIKFDEGSGGDAKDTTSNQNNGVITGASWLTTNTNCKDTNCLSYSGSANYVIVADNSTLDFNDADFTLSGWIYRDAASSSNDTIIAKRNGIANSDQGYILYIDNSNSKLTFEVCDGTSSCDEYSLVSTSTVADDTWTHFSVVWDDDSAANTEMYLNGVDDDATDAGASIGSVGNLSTAHNIRIGAESDGGEAYQGRIDEIKVYNYARSPGEIKTDFNLPSSGTGASVGTGATGTKATAPVGWWKLDEQYGDSANASGSDLTVDGNLAGSGTACPPTSGACPAWYASGKQNAALDFDGGDYVEIADDADLDFNNVDFSISGWVYRDTTGTDDVIVSKANGFASGDQGYIVYIDDPTNTLTLELSDATDEYKIQSTTTLATTGWNHFVIVWDDDNATNSEIYINGIDDNGSDTGAAIGSIGDLSNTRPLRIGSNSNATPADHFDGKIDEVKVFNVALTDAQIKVEFNSSSSLSVSTTTVEATTLADGAGTNPIGNWSLDENTGINTAFDTSGNVYDLTLTSIAEGDWVPGTSGSAIDFDGASDYATAATENGNFSLNSYSISTWLYRQADSAGIEAVLDNRDSATDGWSLFIDAGDKLSCSYNNTLSVGTTTIALNTWYHAECTSSGTLQVLYLNGVQEDSDAISGSISEATDFRIATQSYGTSQKFSGYLDAIKVHNYARTPGQVAYDYNRGGPVGWWRFDECLGTTANDATGNALTGTITAGTSGGDNDSVGNCSSGASAPTDEMWDEGTTGKLNASLEFDDVNDYVSVTSNARLDLTSRLSISFWVNTDENEADNVVVSKGASYEVGINADGDVYWEGTNTSDDASAKVLAGTWHHVTITNDEATLSYYVDGELTSPPDTSNVLIGANNATALYIGHDGAGGNYFDGQIDEVKIFNYVLSAAQVKQVFNSGAVRFN